MSEETGQREYHKERWGDGPWMKEPDRLEWEHKGFPCLMLRNPMGAWCGYVAVPPSHPLFEVGYSDCTRKIFKLGRLKIVFRPLRKKCRDGWCSHTPNDVLSVHGGLTYADHCGGHICHVPKPGQPDNVWWFGFDCAHAGDVVPSMKEMEKHLGFPSPLPGWGFPESYKDVEYVKQEVEKLAVQLAKAA